MDANISVMIRVKPLNDEEKGVKSNQLWKVFDESTIGLIQQSKVNDFQSRMQDGKIKAKFNYERRLWYFNYTWLFNKYLIFLLHIFEITKKNHFE